MEFEETEMSAAKSRILIASLIKELLFTRKLELLLFAVKHKDLKVIGSSPSRLVRSTP